MVWKHFLRPVFAILATTSLALLSGPAVAGAARTDDPDLIAAMQRDLHLSAAEAYDRIDRDLTASHTQHDLRARLGAAYGGAWLDDGDRLRVAVTGEAAAATVRAAGAEVVLVPRGESDLDGLAAKLTTTYRERLVSTYVDVRANQVVVE